MDKNDYDFCGWATRTNIKCADGRTIMPGAFKEMDGKKVPLVWNHDHENLRSVIGHALLKVHPSDGVYAYGKFNDSIDGREAKIRVDNGDIDSLSIYANQIKQQGANVVHGNIREVSLVLAGANPGAFIDTVVKHSDDCDEEAIIYNNEILSVARDQDDVMHADPETDGESKKSDDKTVQEVIDSMTDEQREVMYALVGQALESNPKDEDNEDDEEEKDSEGGDNVKHNVFDAESRTDNTELVHSALDNIINDAKQGYSMKRVFNDYVENSENGEEIMHAATYGVDPVDYLFPEAKTTETKPVFIQRDMGWVSDLMNSVHHTPFSRVKSVFADITEDEARARGYMKGKLKKDEVFTLLKRTTTPTTIYKRQKMDRDDVIDITDFDVVSWLKSEMRMMLDEEIARAILVGDGRLASSDDKIPENNIRPIWTDEDLYTIKAVYTQGADTDTDAANFIDTAIRSRKDYKGSGNPTLFTTEDVLTDMLLMKDKIGHYLYDSVATLATRLRVSKIVTVEVMEGLTRTVDSKTHTLKGIIVNPVDYNVGADRGGAVSMFDDFDIDYNQQKYLIETRCSGALIRPFSAIAIESTTE